MSSTEALYAYTSCNYRGVEQPDRVLIVLPQQVVEHWIERIKALECLTWGELRKNVLPEVYEEVLGLAGYADFDEYSEHLTIKGSVPLPGAEEVARERFEQVANEPPTDGEAFDPYVQLGACADGDWPPHPFYLGTKNCPRTWSPDMPICMRPP